MQVKNRYFRIAFTVTIIGFISLVLFELVLHFVPLNDPKVSVFVEDRCCEYRFNPVYFNRFGHWDIVRDSIPARESKRLLLLGDSFGCTMLPLQYSISQQIEKLSEGEWEILNASVPGWCTRNQLGYLRCYGGEINPHTVALLFFVGNDFSENIPGAKVEIYRGRQVFCSHEGSLIIHLLRKIKTFRVFEAVSKHILYRAPPVDSNFPTEGVGSILQDSIPDETLIPSIPEKKFFQIQKRRLVNYRLSPSRRYLKGVQITYNLISVMRDFCRNRGWNFKVIILPAEIQVSHSLQQEVIEKYELDLNKYDFLLPQKRIKGYLDSLNISNIDVYKVFRNLPSDSANERIYRLRDTHFSRYGNRIAATAIESWL